MAGIADIAANAAVCCRIERYFTSVACIAFAVAITGIASDAASPNRAVCRAVAGITDVAAGGTIGRSIEWSLAAVASVTIAIAVAGATSDSADPRGTSCGAIQFG